jgi:hypothetical protein
MSDDFFDALFSPETHELLPSCTLLFVTGPDGLDALCEALAGHGYPVVAAHWRPAQTAAEAKASWDAHVAEYGGLSLPLDHFRDQLTPEWCVEAVADADAPERSAELEILALSVSAEYDGWEMGVAERRE